MAEVDGLFVKVGVLASDFTAFVTTIEEAVREQREEMQSRLEQMERRHEEDVARMDDMRADYESLAGRVTELRASLTRAREDEAAAIAATARLKEELAARDTAQPLVDELRAALQGLGHMRPPDWEDDELCFCRIHLPDHYPACLTAREVLARTDEGSR